MSVAQSSRPPVDPHMPKVRRPRKLRDIQQSITRLESELHATRLEERLSKGLIQIACTRNVMGRGCGKFTAINDITYIQTYWYTPPRGCTEGAYWNQGEGNWFCLKCGHRNRLYLLPEIQKMKQSFLCVVNEYDKKVELHDDGSIS